MKYILLITATIISINTTFSQKNKKSPKPVKLMVGIVVDQMCYEYLYRYAPKFSKNGFLKLMENGSHCRNVHYNYVPTFTGPGHASIYTGTTPNNHGIVANDWFDRNTNSNTNCVDDSTVTSIGSESLDGKCSPHNLNANTITDQLKLTYPNAKVISMSIKDRGAILPGGHLSDGSFWFDYETGKMITSSYFKKELPYWVRNFNDKNYPEKSLKEVWNTYNDIKTYTESGPDNSPYEELIGNKKTPTFPYYLDSLTKGKKDFTFFTSSPFANTYLTDFAIESLYNEMLGQDNQIDMLCVSYSTPDIVGHAFGPYSIEMEDIYIRLDLEIARLISALEEKIGKDNFTLFLTADHAVVPVPQYLMDKKLPGGYFFKEEKTLKLIDEVKLKFGADLILTNINNNIYLNQDLMREMKLNSAEVENYIAGIVRNWEHVKAVYTTSDFNSSGSGTNWFEMIRLGYYPYKSGEVIYILEPGYLPKSKDSEEARRGTSHGAAFNYDTHVPLIWYGNGIKKQEVFRRINITDITATLTHLLKVQEPNATTGLPILEILKK